MTLAAIADLTLTVRFGGAVLDSVVVQVVIRELTATPLTAASVANQTGATGNTVDLTIGAAVGGRSPYSYAYANLPEELGAIGRRIRGRLITPGVMTVTVTVTDTNGDTDTETFTWTVTGAAILPPTGINVRMDWGRSFFSRSESDVTGRMRSGVNISRGRTINSAVLGRTAAGSMSFALDNSDGLYDLENVASSLFGLIEPGILVQFRDGGDVLWTGVLDSIPTTYDDNSGQHRAHVSAWGVYATLRDATVAEGSLEPAPTIQAFCDLLETNDVCGVPDPSANFFQMQRWWEVGALRDGLRHIEDTEGGFAFEDRLGNIGLQDAGHRGRQTLKATFTGLPVALAGEIKVAGRPKREIAVKDVVNEVVGFTRQYETVSGQTVFQRQDAIAIDEGSTVTLFADFVGAGGSVSSLDVPVSGTDYTMNDAMDGSGNDRSSLVTVAATISQFNEIEVAVVYPVGAGPAEIFITSLNIKGSILRNLPPAKVVRRTQSSIGKYKLKTLELRDTWIQNQANMEVRADAILALLDSPEKRLEFSFYLADYTTFRDLELSDRIRLKLPSYTDDAFIEHLALHIPLSGVLPVCTIQATVTALGALPPPITPPPPVIPMTVPDQPTGLAATAAQGNVPLAWDDPGDSSITSYQILRRDVTGGGSLAVHINSVPAGTSYTDATDVLDSTTYSYRIKARNAQGLSPQSGFVNVTTLAAPTTDTAPVFADDTGDAQNWTQNVAIAPITVPPASGSPTPTYAVVGSPPTGISFSPSTRVISGTPTATGSGTLTIRATNAEGSDDWTVAYATTAGMVGGQSVTVPLTGISVFDDYIYWSDNQSLGSVFDANNTDQTLTDVDLRNSGPSGEVFISIIGTNNRFTPAFEATGRIIFEASDGETLEVTIGDADMSEPYAWVPSNSAEVVAFVLHVKGLTDQDATLTLSE